MTPKTLLAIDPGSGKCGMALVHRSVNGKVELLWRAIALREQTIDRMREAHDVDAYSLAVIGSGTGSKALVSEIRAAFPSLAILVVDERDTSLQARERYWEHHKRRGWRRVVPATLQVPPEPVDDFVAQILAERVLTP